MVTTFSETDLGPLSLVAPTSGLRHVRATYGHLWQWTGDGQDLFSLSVAVRETRLGTPVGARDHLRHELELMRLEPLVRGREAVPAGAAGGATGVDVCLDGAIGAEAAEVTGELHGNRVRQRIVVSTDGELMHVVRLIVPDTDPGDKVLSQVTSSLRVRPWELPA